MWNREHVLSGRGLARRPLYQHGVAQCIHNKSYCADRDVCRFQIWTKGYREHFTVLAIWTLMYRELVSRTFCRGCVPRTYMNGPTVIPLTEQTLQVGQNEQAQVRNFACYTWKSSIHCGGRPSFLFSVYTFLKSGVRPRMRGPYKFGGAQKAGQTPQLGQVICLYTKGQKAGWPGVQSRNRSTV